MKIIIFEIRNVHKSLVNNSSKKGNWLFKPKSKFQSADRVFSYYWSNVYVCVCVCVCVYTYIHIYMCVCVDKHFYFKFFDVESLHSTPLNSFTFLTEPPKRKPIVCCMGKTIDIF